MPAEAEYAEQRPKAGVGDRAAPPVLEELAREARRRGLWNLCLPAVSGLTQREYASIAEITGWSHDLAPPAMNCQAPDTGNMELLHLVGAPGQKRRWLE